MKRLIHKFFVLLAIILSSSNMAFAQFKVEVVGAGAVQQPVTIVEFRGEASAPQKISKIVAADLERSGRFKGVDAGSMIADESLSPDMAVWRQRAVDSLVTGSITRQADGRYNIRFALWDVVKGSQLGASGFIASEAELRRAAHKVADYVYEQLTGEKGVFATRVAYIVKNGARYSLMVADSDGLSAKPMLTSPEPIISPRWSPRGGRLAYVSFESKKPVIYTQGVAVPDRRLIASFKGSNSAPAWSPDAQTLAMTLTRDGGSQLFTVPAAGGQPTRLTQTSGIETEPVFSPNGQQIYFVSDRGGAPQIYRMDRNGGPASRVTFSGNYNISPAISPDGRWLAYISRIGGGYKLYVMDLNSGDVRALTETSADESPSFAPNSRLIMYATQIQGREALMTTTLDGRIKTRLATTAGDIREPAWGPFEN